MSFHATDRMPQAIYTQSLAILCASRCSLQQDTTRLRDHWALVPGFSCGVQLPVLSGAFRSLSRYREGSNDTRNYRDTIRRWRIRNETTATFATSAPTTGTNHRQSAQTGSSNPSKASGGGEGEGHGVATIGQRPRPRTWIRKPDSKRSRDSNSLSSRA